MALKHYMFLLIAGLAVPLPAFGVSQPIRVLPADVSHLPVSVQATNGDFGPLITVLYRTNETTLNEFLSGHLEVSDEDNQIAYSQVDKVWTENGVQFQFTMAPAYLPASRFTITDQGHIGKT